MEKCLAKLPFGKENLEKYGELISKFSFALGLLIELTIVIVEKSEYIIQYEGLWFRLTFVLFGISLITTKHHLREWIALLFFGVIGVISYEVTGRNEILRWVVFIWACQGKDMKKVFKFTFWYTLAGCALLFFLSLTGLYGTMYLETIFRPEFYGDMESIERRYCFGMGHPNSFHCMMLVITWLGIYIYFERLKLQSYLLLLLFHIGIFFFTDSRTGLLMSISSLGICVILHIKNEWKDRKWIYAIGALAVLSCILISVLMAVYSTNLAIFELLDRVLSGRIFALMDSNRYEGMIHTWKIWSAEENNFFFDLGIVRFFYWYGIIPGIIYFGAQFKLLWCGYQKKDIMLLLMVVIINIYSVFEAHFISEYMGRNYILFFFGMYLMNMLDVKDNEIEAKRCFD